MSARRDIVIGLRESIAKDVLALRLSADLEMEFRMRESSYFGGLYFTTRQPHQPLGSEEVLVFANLTPQGRPEYPEAPECPLLVEFRNSARTADDALALVVRLSEVPCQIVRS